MPEKVGPDVLEGYDCELETFIDSIPGPARILLCDPVGSGRAYSVAIAIRHLSRRSHGLINCLVITPWSRVLSENWRDLIVGFGLPDVKLLGWDDSETHRLPDGGILVASPDVLHEFRDDLRNTEWGVVVFDDPQGWLSEGQLRTEAQRLWEDTDNVSVAIALTPTTRQGNWLVTHPKTRILRRKHWKLIGDTQHTNSLGKDPIAQQRKLDQAAEVLRDYLGGESDRSGRVMAQKMYSFIEDLNAKMWINTGGDEPLWSQIMTFVAAVGWLFAHAEAGPSEDLDEIKVRLPSENDLASLFGVHRVTVRRAFEELQKQGLLAGGYGGRSLKVGPRTSLGPQSGLKSADPMDVEKVMLEFLVRRGESGDSESMIKALREASDRLELLAKDTNFEDITSSEAPTVLTEFQAHVDRYGLVAKVPVFHEAIRSSLLSNGRPLKALPDVDANVLRQLDVGWPTLSEYGRRIGRELIATQTREKSEAFKEVLDLVPPRIVSLVLELLQPGQDVYTGRFPAPKETWSIGDGPLGLSFDQLVWCEEIHRFVVKLGDELVGLGIADKREGPAYRGAKWDASFYNVAGAVVESTRESLNRDGISLEEPKRLLGQYALLTKPIGQTAPSLLEFESAGIPRETLHSQLIAAVDRNIVTRLVEHGPAFLVLDQDSYKEVIIWPALRRVVASLVDPSP